MNTPDVHRCLRCGGPLFVLGRFGMIAHACRPLSSDGPGFRMPMTVQMTEAALEQKFDLDRTEPYPTGLFVAPSGRRSASVACELVRRANAGVR